MNASRLTGIPKPRGIDAPRFLQAVQEMLEAAGFEPHATRALVVKHTVAWSKVSAPELAPVLRSTEAAPPAYRINGEHELQSPKGRLAATRDT